MSEGWIDHVIKHEWPSLNGTMGRMEKMHNIQDEALLVHARVKMMAHKYNQNSSGSKRKESKCKESSFISRLMSR